MDNRILKKKPVQAALALALAAGIALAGTTAWNSFAQSRVNIFKTPMAPDVNLHDDFAGGPNKDIYVENSGAGDVYIRVRLTEFLQTENRGSLVEGHVRDDDKAKLWAPHNGAGPDGFASERCALILPDRTAAAWGSDTFHDYYAWTVGGAEGGAPGGQIYYKPADDSQKSQYDDDGNLLSEPAVVSDPLTETGAHGDAHLDYKAQVDELTAGGMEEAAAMAELGIAKTLTSRVVSMSDWTAGTGGLTQYELGDFWVLDEADGWCYWASPLKPGTATGLLLDKVERTNKPFDSNAEYCVNAWLQAVDASDLGRFETADSGGISDGGKKLLGLAAGKLTVAADGGTYQVNGDGTYTQTAAPDGTAILNAKPFVALAVDEAGASLGVNAPAASRLEIGARVDLADLGWNGTRYQNYETYSGEPKDGWYNLSAGSTYEVTGARVGEDGLTYLTLCSVVENNADRNEPLYLASVVQEPAAVTLAAEADAASAPAYRLANPGAGPYTAIDPGADGVPGSPDDALHPAGSFEEYFLTGLASEQLSAGFTFEADGYDWVVLTTDQYGNRLIMTTTTVTEMGARAARYTHAAPAYADTLWPARAETFVSGLTALKPCARTAALPDEPVYAAGTTWDAIPATDGLSSCINSTDGYLSFPLSGGEYVKYMLGDSALSAYQTVQKADGTGTETSALRSRQNDAEGEAMAISGTGTRYNAYADSNYPPRMAMWVRLSDADSIATADELAAWKNTQLTEDFLFGKSSADLKAGGTFTAGGVAWAVLNVDKYGNRLIMTEGDAGKSIYGAKTGGVPVYAGSSLDQAMQTYFSTTMSASPLKPLVLDANVPENGVSSARSTQTNPAVFALSAVEVETFLPKQSDPLRAYTADDTNGWRTRSPNSGSKDHVFTVISTGELQGTSNPEYEGHVFRPAMWVRFSDADRIATATASELEMWKTRALTESFLAGKTSEDLAVNSTFKTDRYDWVVLDVDPYGNRLIMRETYVQRGTFNQDSAKGNVYAGSDVQAFLQTRLDADMPTLKPYVLDAATPVESGTWSASMAAQKGALSSARSTQDAPTVFMPSQSEFLKYGIATKFPPASGVKTWTRTPGGASDKAVAVDKSGVFSEQSNTDSLVLYYTAWVRFSDADVIATASPAEMEAWKNMPAVGSTVTFGTYPQDQTAATPVQPIQWRVLSTEGTKALVITDKIIDHCARVTGRGNVTYSVWYPVMTQFLNSTGSFAGAGFLEKAQFTAAERAMVQSVTLQTETAFDATTYTTETATVFLLSQTEVRQYMAGAGQRQAYTTAYARNGFSGASAETTSVWYLRTPSTGGSVGAGEILNGEDVFGAAYGYLNRGFRPAMWVDYAP